MELSGFDLRPSEFLQAALIRLLKPTMRSGVPPPSWTPPSEFEEYRLVRRLGFGSMGQVWLAHDLLLDRRVAIKFIGVITEQTSVRDRFHTEARAIARLSHPNVVTIHRIGTLDHQPYMVSELIDGTSLDQLAQPLTAPALFKVAVELARGLAAAHRAGILHRDVKPANAMVTRDGVAKLLDFGLAKFGAETVTPFSAPAPAFVENILADPEATPGPALEVAQTYASPKATPHHSQTDDGAILGTPLYLAPECWQGAPASRRTDVYSFGALMYHLCAGQAPVRFLGNPNVPISTLAASLDARPLLEVAPLTDARLAAVVDRCVARTPALRFADGDALRDALERLHLPRHEAMPSGNPYRGLSAFEAEHRALFFGRDTEVRAVCDRLRGRSLVVVAGESGVGKSSLCRAGILPAVAGNALGNERTWRTLSCLPGRHPLRSLAGTFAELLKTSEGELYTLLSSEPSSLARLVVKAVGPTAGLVVFVDQLEEWVTFGEPEEAAASARAFESLCDGLPGVRVLATARIDLLSRLAALPGIGADLSSALFLLGPVRPEQLRDVVVAPATAFGIRFETEALVDNFVTFAAQGGALPLLQFALARLWEMPREGPVLTEKALAHMGGVSGALAAHADGVVDSMPASEREVTPELFLSLVNENDQRRRRLETELVTTSVHRAALNTLARARLLSARDGTAGTEWEIAHEALIRQWPTFAEWLTDDAQSRRWRERLAASTAEWERLSRAPEALWGERQLSEGARVLPSLQASDEQVQFLASSRQRIRWRKLRVPAGVAGVLLLLALVYAGIRWQAHREAALHLEAADRHHEAAAEEKAHFERVQAQAFAAFDQGDWPVGETEWAQARTVRDAWFNQLELARAEVEVAQVAFPEHAGLKARLIRGTEARIAYEAANEGDSKIEAEIRRLEGLGDIHEVAGRSTPSRLSLAVSPSSAVVMLSRYESFVAGSPAGVTPAPDLELAPGSYRLEVAADGHAPASLPFVMRRGQRTELKVHLVEAAKMPAGFVHLPGGLSLVGASASSVGDEVVRSQFYEAAPLHPVFIDDFLMAQHEVTFRQWLEYVDALSGDEKTRRTPHLNSSLGTADTANFHLRRVNEAWSLTFRPVSQVYSAREGELLHYADRVVHADQDWLDMPVVAISPVDVEAYAGWLHQTGKVPGARMCTEYEWERAARGADGRTLPHGEVSAPDDANIDETYGRLDAAYGPDEVGQHVKSRSPFGIDDLFGNVWEIVRPTSKAKAWANKGGSWYVNRLSGRIPNQWVINPGYRQVETGARICAPRPR